MLLFHSVFSKIHVAKSSKKILEVETISITGDIPWCGFFDNFLFDMFSLSIWATV